MAALEESAIAPQEHSPSHRAETTHARVVTLIRGVLVLVAIALIWLEIAAPSRGTGPVRLSVALALLFALGALIGYGSRRELALKRRLTILQEIGSQWNPRLGVDRTICVNLERMLDFFNASECILVLGRPTNPPQFFTFTASCRKSPRSSPPNEMAEGSASVLLALPDALSTTYGSVARPSWSAFFVRPAATTAPATHRETLERLANLLDTERFATAPYRQRDGTQGRVFVIPKAESHDLDVAFLSQLVSAIAQTVENTQLTDQLVLKAAEHERFRISLDIHDTTVQPYIGLKLGLDALHREAGEENPLSRRISELLEMATMTIRDLRGYATALREMAPMTGSALVAAAEEQAQRFNRFYGIEVDVQSDPEMKVGAQVAAEVFRIISEGLSNVMRHTTARRAFVRLQTRDGWLQLAIGNESGKDSSAPRSFIPRSIHERAVSLGGTSYVENSQDGHTIVHVSIPT
jgi:signal transduction histidine kinase